MCIAGHGCSLVGAPHGQADDMAAARPFNPDNPPRASPHHPGDRIWRLIVNGWRIHMWHTSRQKGLQNYARLAVDERQHRAGATAENWSGLRMTPCFSREQTGARWREPDIGSALMHPQPATGNRQIQASLVFGGRGFLDKQERAIDLLDMKPPCTASNAVGNFQ